MKQKFSKNSSLFHTQKEHIIKAENVLSETTTVSYDSDTVSNLMITESDKLAQNTNIINDVSLEQAMQNTPYTHLETKKKGFTVIFEFPQKSDDEEMVHGEVKQVLSNLLQEQLLKQS